MSVNLDDIRLPYGMYFTISDTVSSGAGSFVVPEQFRNITSDYGSYRWRLPGGVSTVQVSWSGEEAVDLIATDRWTAFASALYRVGTIPAAYSGTARSFTFQYSSANGGGLLHAAPSTPFGQYSRDRNYTLGVTVFPIAEYTPEDV